MEMGRASYRKTLKNKFLWIDHVNRRAKKHRVCPKVWRMFCATKYLAPTNCNQRGTILIPDQRAFSGTKCVLK